MTENIDRPVEVARTRRRKKVEDGAPTEMTTDLNRAPTAPAASPPPSPVMTGAPTPGPATTAPTKSATVIKLLLRAKGATPIELIAATDWQPHSVRAFLSGLRKKGRVLVRKERKGGGFAYHMAVLLPAPAAMDDVLPQAVPSTDHAPSLGGAA